MRRILNFLRNLRSGGARQGQGAIEEVSPQVDFGQPRDRRQPSFQDPHDQMDMNEFFEVVQSDTQEGFEITGIQSRMTTTRIVRRLTADGFVTEVKQTLLQTNYGGILTQEELVGGGQCICGEYADRGHFYLCEICGIGLCQLHVSPVDGVPLCPDHSRQVLHNLDTWK